MWEYNYTDELYHYGVPGMKWGRRRARGVGIASSQKPRRPVGSTSWDQAKPSKTSQILVGEKKYNKSTPEQKKAAGMKAAAISLAAIGATAVTAFGISLAGIARGMKDLK